MQLVDLTCKTEQVIIRGKYSHVGRYTRRVVIPANQTAQFPSERIDLNRFPLITTIIWPVSQRLQSSTSFYYDRNLPSSRFTPHEIYQNSGFKLWIRNSIALV